MEPIDDLVRQIAEDHESGASALTHKALDCWEAFAALPRKKGWLQLRDALSHAQPDMAPLLTVSEEIVAAAADAAPEEYSRVILRQVQSIRQRLHEASTKITATAWELFPDPSVLLTHSYSGTVKTMLCDLHRMGKTMQVIVTESRPLLEGRRLAQDLGREGIHTTLLVDAAAASTMDRVDAVVVGADRVTETVFVNKIGTLSLLLTAANVSRPAYLVCDTTKFLLRGAPPLTEKTLPSKEVLAEAYPNVSVENRYFEEVPLDLLTGIICDKGLILPQDLRHTVS